MNLRLLADWNLRKKRENCTRWKKALCTKSPKVWSKKSIRGTCQKYSFDDFQEGKYKICSHGLRQSRETNGFLSVRNYYKCSHAHGSWWHNQGTVVTFTTFQTRLTWCERQPFCWKTLQLLKEDCFYSGTRTCMYLGSKMKMISFP